MHLESSKTINIWQLSNIFMTTNMTLNIVSHLLSSWNIFINFDPDALKLSIFHSTLWMYSRCFFFGFKLLWGKWENEQIWAVVMLALIDLNGKTHYGGWEYCQVWCVTLMWLDRRQVQKICRVMLVSQFFTKFNIFRLILN